MLIDWYIGKTRYYSFDYFPNFNLKTEELFSFSAIQKVQQILKKVKQIQFLDSAR